MMIDNVWTNRQKCKEIITHNNNIIWGWQS